MPCGFPYCGGNDCANCHKPAPPPLPAHLIWNEYTVPGWPKDVKTPKPADGVLGTFNDQQERRDA